MWGPGPDRRAAGRVDVVEVRHKWHDRRRARERERPRLRRPQQPAFWLDPYDPPALPRGAADAECAVPLPELAVAAATRSVAAAAGYVAHRPWLGWKVPLPALPQEGSRLYHAGGACAVDCAHRLPGAAVNPHIVLHAGLPVVDQHLGGQARGPLSEEPYVHFRKISLPQNFSYLRKKEQVSRIRLCQLRP